MKAPCVIARLFGGLGNQRLRCDHHLAVPYRGSLVEQHLVTPHRSRTSGLETGRTSTHHEDAFW